MAESVFHRLVTRTEEALLARTLKGRRLERDVCDESGKVCFAAGREIDQAILDEARELSLLEELAHAAEPGTSDTELEDLLWWRKHHHDQAREGHD
ncbi:hypothetical protein [Vulgatibacter sp.]|uniref:hypothetical protein n=1 Tax=Vulgatibacter sp. TaxID=1971226 RepID=UPI003569B7D0